MADQFLTSAERAALLRRLPSPDRRRAIRQACGLSLGRVARDCFVRPQAVAGWERGLTPSDAVLEAYVGLLEELAAISEIAVAAS